MKLTPQINTYCLLLRTDIQCALQLSGDVLLCAYVWTCPAGKTNDGIPLLSVAGALQFIEDISLQKWDGEEYTN